MAQVMASRVTTLAVAYSDANTVRSRLVGVAQCVRELCSAAGHSAQLPQLALPRIARFGFWHMGFRSEDDFAAAIETLHGRELGPTAGCPAVPFTPPCHSHRRPIRTAVPFASPSHSHRRPIRIAVPFC